MQKVMFTHRGGRQERMAMNFAKILHGLKRGTYQTRDMRADPVIESPKPEVAPIVETPTPEPETEKPKESKRAYKKRLKAKSQEVASPDEAENECED